MIDPKVIDYIKSETAKGVSRDDIVKNLIKGGGWTMADIQDHFSALDKKTDSVFSTSIQYDQSSQLNNGQVQQKKRMNVFKANFLIFIAYYIVSIVFTRVSGGDSLFGFFIFYGYILHSGILIILSVIDGLRGVIYKTKTNAGKYFLTAILLLIIGFGACAFSFMSGLIGLY